MFLTFRGPFASHDSNPCPNRSRIMRYKATKEKREPGKGDPVKIKCQLQCFLCWPIWLFFFWFPSISDLSVAVVLPISLLALFSGRPCLLPLRLGWVLRKKRNDKLRAENTAKSRVRARSTTFDYGRRGGIHR